MKEVLIISPYFPPIGGSGVYRLHRWAKYLPEFGIRPLVVHFDRLPGEPWDSSLLQELSGEVVRYPVRYLEPSLRGLRSWLKKDDSIPAQAGTGSGWENARNPGSLVPLIDWVRSRVLIPDTAVTWIPPAWRVLKKIMREHDPAAVITTSSPETSHLLGLRLKRKYGLPWIADFRDPWTDSVMVKKPAWPFDRIEGMLERSVVMNADRVISYSEGLGELLWKKLGPRRPDKFLSLGPAVDADRFDPVPASERKYAFLYAGTLTDHYPLEFFFALRALNRGRRERGEPELRAAVAGKLGPRTGTRLKELAGEGWLDLLGYLPHDQALALLKSAKVLVLLHSADPWWVPGKLAEYLHSGKPILAVVGRGELGSLLEKFPRLIFAPDDRGRLAEPIAQVLALPEAPRALPKEFTARGQTEILARLIEGLERRKP